MKPQMLTTDADKAVLAQGMKAKGYRDGNWLELWSDLALYFSSHRDNMYHDKVEGKESLGVETTAPQIAKRALSSSLGAILRPAGKQWFSGKHKNDALNQNPFVQRWLQTATRILYDHMYAPRADMMSNLAQVDDDLVTFGTGGSRIGWNAEGEHLTFKAYHLNKVALATDSYNKINRSFCFHTMRLAEIVDQFGEDKLTAKMQEKLNGDKADPDCKFEIMQAVVPNAEYRMYGKNSPRNKPFVSLWFAVDEKEVMDKGGFDEFPDVWPRWNVLSEEVYGRGPSEDALPLARVLNAMWGDTMDASEKSLNPPLTAPSDVVRGDWSMRAGKLNIWESNGLYGQELGKSPIMPVPLGTQPRDMVEMMGMVEERIHAAFYRDVLELPSARQSDMTATEINARLEQYLRQAAPVFARVEADYNAQLVKRCFSILFREGQFPPLPQELDNEDGIDLDDFEFEYESPIKQARDRAESMKIAEYVAGLAPLAQMQPQVLDNVDFDVVTRLTGSQQDVPMEIFKPLEEVMQKREADAKKMEAMQMAELANKAAPAMSAAAQMGGTVNDMANSPAGIEGAESPASPEQLEETAQAVDEAGMIPPELDLEGLDEMEIAGEA